MNQFYIFSFILVKLNLLNVVIDVIKTTRQVDGTMRYLFSKYLGTMEGSVMVSSHIQSKSP
jgi:hypothetical protein